MQLGQKIRKARIEAEIAREEAAKELGVSVQTVADWETGRSSPDILSTVKMSALYHVSLDEWLHADGTGTEYVKKLKEDSDVVRQKKRMTAAILFGIWFLIWSAALLVYWIFTDGSDALGYALVFHILVLPLAIFGLSLFFGLTYGLRLWWAAPVFGFMYMLSEYITFSLENMIVFQRFNVPDWIMIAAGIAVSFLGMGIGTLVRVIRRKNRSRTQEGGPVC